MPYNAAMEKLVERKLDLTNPEQPFHKEIIYLLEASAITISGPSGSGKTTEGMFLAKEYGIKLYEAGGAFREKVREERHHEIIGPAIRTTEEDMNIDEKVAVWVKKSKDEKRIIEGRLAGYVSSKVINEMTQNGETPPKVIKILIKADFKTRIDRIFQRQVLENPNITREEIEQETLKREAYDLEIWYKSHPKLVGKDPFSEEFTDDLGNKVYDLVINTSNMSPEQAAKIVHTELVRRGLVRHIEQHPVEDMNFENNS